MADWPFDSLRARLDYEPVELRFGTSGRRGEVRHLSQLEVYINALAEIEYLQSLPPGEGGTRRGAPFYIACDLRPSCTRRVAEQGGRGEIVQAVVRAALDAGMRPVNLGRIPTPALAHYALARACGSVMVTGSHIPFDRNGYKLNTARGELLKKDEAPVNERVARVRAALYRQPFDASPFDGRGDFKAGHRELPPESGEARDEYIERYAEFFAGRPLLGMRVLCYQHSAVGRDILVEILERLGARAIAAGRSGTFVPIDTENVQDELVAAIQGMADRAAAEHGPIDAVASTDGDSDRPLLLGIEAGRLLFFGGDLLGMVTAEFLGADAVVVPVSCNDAIDRGSLRPALEPRTRIGSPYVIEGMERARRKGRRAVCGWEANGGFLTGSAITRAGRTLSPLPTRDALLPLLAVLAAARERGCGVAGLFARLPQRRSRAALIRDFPRPASAAMMRRFSPTDERVREAAFDPLSLTGEEGGIVAPSPSAASELGRIREELQRLFTPELGFSPVAGINWIDGVRVLFASGEVAHVRPSGNADELRIYAVADDQARADAIARAGVAEPDGILRRMERMAC
ncbi:MAG: phosphomannomutase [Acidobacteria bacterium]|nr:phosphomannomutase [Acidobacteriota bacterium]